MSSFLNFDAPVYNRRSTMASMRQKKLNKLDTGMKETSAIEEEEGDDESPFDTSPTIKKKPNTKKQSNKEDK